MPSHYKPKVAAKTTIALCLKEGHSHQSIARYANCSVERVAEIERSILKACCQTRINFKRNSQ